MIAIKTVFVLGAGAHCPYQLIDGRTLTSRIVTILPKKDRPENGFWELFVDRYGSKFGSIASTMVEFRKMLEYSGHVSIDSFLATHSRREAFPEIGKLAVAEILRPLEFKASFSRLAGATQDWMSFLFEYMLHGCQRSAEDFINKNPVSFVSFNYDRTLEYFLCLRMAATYGLSIEAAWEIAKRIPIVHVYGSLGDFSPQLLARREPFTPTELLQSASGIRLMYEDREDKSGIDAAKMEIDSAAVVCFLGFSFDPDNIARLELNSRCVGKLVGATRYQMADGDWARVRSSMSPTDFNFQADRKWDSLTFLHETELVA